MGLDYKKTHRKLLKAYKEERSLKRKAYILVLLTQLRNGSRISEAIEALKLMLSSGKSEVHVRVRKHKHETLRLMVFPLKASPKVYKWALGYLQGDPEKLKLRIIKFARRRFKINTHSLRYAWITYNLLRGINPSLIAKITGHAKLDYILHYTQQREAEKILKNME